MATAIAALSPRLSFSHDIDLSPLHPPPPVGEADGEDFDFSVSREMSSIQEPSPADELFYRGKLLPLSSSLNSSSSATIRPPPVLEITSHPIPPADGGNIGRSCSVGAGTGKSRLSSICSFPRSKSTGSYQTQKRASPVSKKSHSQSQSHNTRSWYSYYYSGSSRRSSSSSGNGVRISPVINVPSPFIPRGGSSGGSSSGSGGGGGRVGGGNSFFAYLLCNCRDKSSRGLENFSP